MNETELVTSVSTVENSIELILAKFEKKRKCIELEQRSKMNMLYLKVVGFALLIWFVAASIVSMQSLSFDFLSLRLGNESVVSTTVDSNYISSDLRQQKPTKLYPVQKKSTNNLSKSKSRSVDEILSFIFPIYFVFVILIIWKALRASKKKWDDFEILCYREILKACLNQFGFSDLGFYRPVGEQFLYSSKDLFLRASGIRSGNKIILEGKEAWWGNNIGMFSFFRAKKRTLIKGDSTQKYNPGFIIVMNLKITIPTRSILEFKLRSKISDVETTIERVSSILSSYSSDSLKYIELEDVAFNDHFILSSNDEFEIRNYFTPTVIKSILEFKEDEFMCGFSNQTLSFDLRLLKNPFRMSTSFKTRIPSFIELNSDLIPLFEKLEKFAVMFKC